MSSTLHLHPVDWFNFFGSFPSIFKAESEIKCNVKSETEVCYLDDDDLNSGLNHTTYKLLDTGLVSVLRNNPHRLAKGSIISRFILLTAVRFKGDYRAAESHVMYKLMDLTLPYFRVGKDYYKLIEKDNRYGGSDKIFKPWSKDTIVDDEGKNVLKLVPKYDDFTIEPDNVTHAPVHKKCYNLYSPFAHTPASPRVTAHDIPTSLGVLRHIFGEHFEQSLKYMKCLYEHPRQILPILVLVSEERVTGKTTFMNWIQMIFGNNSISINPETITSQFNATYADKNIILIDETLMEKATGVEKLKSIATAKTITVNQKHVQGYTIPFFGKIIMSTNKERDFMRIDKEEVRFWIRKIGSIKTKNVKIEDDLFREIPAFLKYLKQLPALDFSKSRMLFTHEEIATRQLTEVKEESKGWLHKDLELLIETFFDNSELSEFYATAIDIKKKWFPNNHQATHSYIVKVLKNEMKLVTQKGQRYWPFGERLMLEQPGGRPFLFVRKHAKLDPLPERIDPLLQDQGNIEPSLDDL